MVSSDQSIPAYTGIPFLLVLLSILSLPLYELLGLIVGYTELEEITQYAIGITESIVIGFFFTIIIILFAYLEYRILHRQKVDYIPILRRLKLILVPLILLYYSLFILGHFITTSEWVEYEVLISPIIIVLCLLFFSGAISEQWMDPIVDQYQLRDEQGID
jgi:hypothetical protein